MNCSVLLTPSRFSKLHISLACNTNWLPQQSEQSPFHPGWLPRSHHCPKTPCNSSCRLAIGHEGREKCSYNVAGSEWEAGSMGEKQGKSHKVLPIWFHQESRREGGDGKAEWQAQRSNRPDQPLFCPSSSSSSCLSIIFFLV